MPPFDAYRNQVSPETTETNFNHMNFAQDAPVLVDGKYRPVRIWPDDETKRTLTDCYCVNCEFGENITLIRCQTAIVRHKIDIAPIEVVIDGKPIIQARKADVVTGRWVPETREFVDYDVPVENVIEEVADGV